GIGDRLENLFLLESLADVRQVGTNAFAARAVAMALDALGFLEHDRPAGGVTFSRGGTRQELGHRGKHLLPFRLLRQYGFRLVGVLFAEPFLPDGERSLPGLARLDDLFAGPAEQEL